MRSLKDVDADYAGAGLIVLLGLVVIWTGSGYNFGTLGRMGSGFMPVVLGTLLTLVGAAMATTTALSRAPSPAAGDRLEAGPFEFRAWTCILGGVLAFVVLGEYGGLVPATFSAVFISAMGDCANTWRSAGLLAAAVTVFGALLFRYALGVQLPLFVWAA